MLNFKQFMDHGECILDEVIKKSKENSKHFFDEGTRKFFSSRVNDLCWRSVKQDETYSLVANGDIIHFITSEADNTTGGKRWHKGCIRGWTIRVLDDTGSISTVGEFQQYESLRAARYGLKEILC
tara:strand:+ start:250 stop:624 length:375 start_codon:yes stop_codon:yes gene_type:complete